MFNKHTVFDLQSSNYQNLFILIDKLYKYCSKLKYISSCYYIKAKSFVLINAQLNNFFLITNKTVSKDNSDKPIDGEVLSIIENKKLLVPTNRDNTNKKLSVIQSRNLANKKLLAISDKRLLVIIDGNTIDKKPQVIENKGLPVISEGNNANEKPLARRDKRLFIIKNKRVLAIANKRLLTIPNKKTTITRD